MFKTGATLRILILLTALGISGQAYSNDLPFVITGSSPYCGGANATVNYDGTAFTFTAGNTFIVELSDATGSFAAPTLIGTLSTTDAEGSIPIIFPTSASGTDYLVRIVSTNPAITGTDNGSPLTITPAIFPAVTILSSPNAPLCNSHSATINASPTGGGTSPGYSWTRNGVPVGTNSPTYAATNFNNGDAIVVTMTSNASCAMPGAVQSNTITIIQNTIVAPTVAIIGPPVICQGSNPTFTANITNGGTTPFFQWKKNSINVGLNSSTYSDNALVSGDVITCSMTSSRECVSVSTVISNTINVTVTPLVTPAITITADPSGSVGTGSVVYVPSTTSNGGPSPSYEWKRNGAVVSGATSNVYVANATTNDEIVVTVTSNANCAQPLTATSNTVTLSVDPNKTRAGHSWETRASQVLGSTIIRSNASGFAMGGSINKIYIGVGFNMVGASVNKRKDFWEYDPATDVWTQKADFGGEARYNAIGFSIGTKGYIGGGVGVSNTRKDFWEYNQANNTWLQRSDIPGQVREQAFSFALNGKGYVGGGYAAGLGDLKDFYEFDPGSNAWTPKAEFGGGKRMGSAAFSIESQGKGFVAGGYSSSNNTWFKDFWAYDQANNTWIKRADMPGSPRTRPTGFALAGNGYVGLGNSSNGYEGQFYQYTMSTNSWSAKPYYPGPASQNFGTGVTLNNRAYVYKDGTWIEYNLFSVSPFPSKICTTENIPISFDASGFPFAPGTTFSTEISVLQNFSTKTILATSLTNTINTLIPVSVASQTYYFRVVSSSPVMSSLTESITITNLPSNHTVTADNGLSVCKDVAVTFRSNLTGTGFQWYKNNTPVGADATSYVESVLANNDVITADKIYTIGCSEPVGVGSVPVTMTIREPPKPTVTVTQPNTLSSTSAVAYQWYKDGEQILNAKSQTYTMTTSGVYKVRISDATGCFTFSDNLPNAFTGLGEDVFSGLVSTYPNPVAGEMTLEVSEDLVAKGCDYSILNELGQAVVGTQKASRMNRISFAGRSPGLYMVRLSVDGATVVRRIMKLE